MDGFKNKFIKLVEKIRNGDILTKDLDSYVKDISNKKFFSDAIKDLMDNKDYLVKVLAARYCYDYDIDKSRAYSIARLVLRNDKTVVCRIEAKYIYDDYKRRHIRKLIRFFNKKKYTK